VIDYQSYVPDYALIDFLVQERVNSDMVADVGITRYAIPVFDNDTGALVHGEATKIYQGKARISTLGGPVSSEYGEEMTFGQQATGYIPLTTEVWPQVNDRFDIIWARTPSLTGRTYRIIDVQRAGQWPAAIVVTLTGTQPQPATVGDVGSEWWTV
jgi:hypothetical protein